MFGFGTDLIVTLTKTSLPLTIYVFVLFFYFYFLFMLLMEFVTKIWNGFLLFGLAKKNNNFNVSDKLAATHQWILTHC